MHGIQISQGEMQVYFHVYMEPYLEFVVKPSKSRDVYVCVLYYHNAWDFKGLHVVLHHSYTVVVQEEHYVAKNQWLI